MTTTIWGGTGGVSVPKQAQYTAAAIEGQTLFNSFSPAGFNYTPGTGDITVYVNGVLQRLNTDWQETSPTSITFIPTGLEVGDVVTVLRRIY